MSHIYLPRSVVGTLHRCAIRSIKVPKVDWNLESHPTCKETSAGKFHSALWLWGLHLWRCETRLETSDS